MASRAQAEAQGLSRRGFLGLVPAAAAGLWVPRALASAAATSLDGRDPASLTPLEREHLPVLRLPELTSNGAKLPIVVEMDHPMTPDHFIRSIEVLNRRDPVPSKGTFHLTPANGRVYLGFQARVHHGSSTVTVRAVCNRHGAWTASRTVVVPDDGGG
jgi:sulfur-oxidizing protein SoxY